MIATMMMLALAQPALRPELQPMAFLIGHCWSGEFTGGARDTHCFEPVFGGRHIRDVHEVVSPKGVYRGETLYSWNGVDRRVEYTYWNSDGGISRGSMTPRGDRLDFGDEVYRGADGRELRIATEWRKAGSDSYETVSKGGSDPTGSRVVRYTKVDPAAVRIETIAAPDGTRSLVHEVVVPAAADQIWAAIATAEGWRSWAVPRAWAQEPDILETSYNPAARPGDAGNIRQRWIARVPGRLLAFRTVKAPDGFPDFDAFRQVSHLFELEPAGEAATRVRLTGVGYAESDAGRRLVAFFREGNKVSLEQLRDRFAKGPVDWNAKLKRSSP